MSSLNNYDRWATAGPPDPEPCNCGHELEDHFEDYSCGECDCTAYETGSEVPGPDIDDWVDAQVESPSVF